MNAPREPPDRARGRHTHPRVAAVREFAHPVILGVAFGVQLLLSLMGWAGLLARARRAGDPGRVSLVARRREHRVARPAADLHPGLPGLVRPVVGVERVHAVLARRASATSWPSPSWRSTSPCVRDTIQIVRATGDVLRVLLGLSLALEVLSGVLLDLPMPFSASRATSDPFGPIQGVFGSRNVLGLVALIAAITFIIELRSRSVRRGRRRSPRSCSPAICLLLTRSPVIVVVALFVGVAALALYWLRRTPAESRWMLQLGLLRRDSPRRDRRLDRPHPDRRDCSTPAASSRCATRRSGAKCGA